MLDKLPLAHLPYCGAPPSMATIGTRWNGDPWLLGALVLLTLFHVRVVPAAGRGRVLAGWIIAALAFTSPLCALSVSLFSARVGQHMILVLAAAPLIGSALPFRASPAGLWGATTAFMLALWFWHMPAPYEATFRSDVTYWAMHVTLFGTGIWLWHELLADTGARAFQTVVAGAVTTVQMSLLGAVLTLSRAAMFPVHYLTVQDWGFTPLSDQQLGGALMWVPGCVLFLWVAMRSMRLLGEGLEARGLA